MSQEKEEERSQKKCKSRNGEYQDFEERVFTKKLKKLWTLLSENLDEKSDKQSSDDSFTVDQETTMKIFQDSNVGLDGYKNSL